MFIFKLIFM